MLITIEEFGDSSLLISWKNEINALTRQYIYHFNKLINQKLSDEILDAVPAYCSLTLFLKDPSKWQIIQKKLFTLYSLIDITSATNSTHWEIPVCYDLSLGIDLPNLCSQLSLCVEDVISLHCAPIYTIDFLGFLPGFPYLSGLDKKLFSPRLASPRQTINRGSVAIGNKQTGIYSVTSPAGWNIIGQTPVHFFDSQLNPPCFLSPMDTLKFIPISLKQFKSFKSDD